MKIKINESKNYQNAQEALEEKSFEFVGYIYFQKDFKTVKKELYKKNNELYYYAGMDHFNTTIYKVFLEKVSNLKGSYETEVI